MHRFIPLRSPTLQNTNNSFLYNAAAVFPNINTIRKQSNKLYIGIYLNRICLTSSSSPFFNIRFFMKWSPYLHNYHFMSTKNNHVTWTPANKKLLINLNLITNHDFFHSSIESFLFYGNVGILLQGKAMSWFHEEVSSTAYTWLKLSMYKIYKKKLSCIDYNKNTFSTLKIGDHVCNKSWMISWREK